MLLNEIRSGWLGNKTGLQSDFSYKSGSANGAHVTPESSDDDINPRDEVT